MNNDDIKTIFADNWQEIKQHIKKEWDKITDSDLKKINGDYEALIDKIAKTYEINPKEIGESISALLANEGFTDFAQEANMLWRKAIDIKDRAKDTIHDSAEKTKAKFDEAHECLESYITANPLKSVLIALGVGLVAGKLFKKS